jgi:hypothetical protein
MNQFLYLIDQIIINKQLKSLKKWYIVLKLIKENSLKQLMYIIIISFS